MDVAAWLQSLGLERYMPAFRDNEIDWDVLPKLTSEDLREIGVAAIGHRRTLLDAIAALGAAAPAAVATAVPSDTPTYAGAERRQLTVMFCDLVGSTELATRLDPEDLREVIGAYHRAVAEVLGQFGGFVAKYMGDGILAYFGYPQAHEEDAEQAARAGLAIVEAVGKLNLGHQLEVRLGIATGLVVVGDLLGTGAAQEQSVIGETANLAARLQSLAGANQIVVADTTRRHIGNLFDVRDLGPQALKGFAGTPRAWQVLSDSGVASRFEALRSGATPLVGRDEELDLLIRRWTQARDGEGRVVLLSAEPGIGKSRLTEALQQRIAAEPHRRLRYFCSPHHQDSALYPIIGQLERAAGFERNDDAAAKREKLANLLSSSETAGPQSALFADLLSVPSADLDELASLSPQQKKEKTFNALLHGLESLARDRPLLMVFEDLHWIDPTSLELLDRTIARVERLPVLLIATFRPEFQPPWVGQSHVTVLALSRLGRREGAALVRELVGNASGLPDDIIEEIIERTDGVPLFLEEVTKVVLEARGAGEAIAAIPGARAAVPATLHASLMARLDRLGPAAREVAQTGAAIGREFAYDLLTAVSPRGETETRRALDQLVAAGLVFQRGTAPAAEYQFKHALVQDTAYGTLLRGPRQALHEGIAAAMRRLMPEIVDRAPELLAHHLTKAGDLDEAAAYWLEAGRRASRDSANIEAAAHLARGIEGLSGLPETPERNRRELELQLALGPVLLSSQGFQTPAVRGAYQRAAELAERSDDDRARFAASWGLWISAQGYREHETRLRRLDGLIEIAERIGDPELTLQAHHCAWASRIWSGDFVRSLEHAHQGLALYDPVKHRHHALMYGGHDPAVCGKGQSGLALWALGYPDQAERTAREGIALAETLGHMASILHALWFAGGVCYLRRDIVAARDYGTRLLALGREHNLAQYETIGGTIRSWALTQLDNREEARAELRSELRTGLHRYAVTAWIMVDVFGAGLAQAELDSGNPKLASAALDEVEKSSQGWWEAELLRLRGDLLLSGADPDPRAAEHIYRQAIARAQSQQAKSLELRAAMALARLWAENGRRIEARGLLAPVYGWFTEGFDTADLKEAKALLDGQE